MPESVKFVLATSAVECAGAILMTVVALRLYRVYNRSYLRHMALSWAALVVYFFASAIALAAAISGVAASHPTRLAASMISLVAGYWQVAWLVIGTTEVGYGGWITRRKELYVLAVCLAVAIITPLLYVTDPAASTQTLFLRFGIKSLVTGLAFVAVGLAVHRARRGRFLGRGMVTFAFVAYGLHQLLYFAFTTHQLSSDRYSPFGPYLTFVDFFLLMMRQRGSSIRLDRRSIAAVAASTSPSTPGSPCFPTTARRQRHCCRAPRRRSTPLSSAAATASSSRSTSRRTVFSIPRPRDASSKPWPSTPSRPTGCRSRSPKASPSRTRGRPWSLCRPCAPRVCESPSTTSGPGSRRSVTCARSPSTW